MIEWNARLPLPHGTKRIRRKFCFIPKRCQQHKMVWLDYVYLFEQIYVSSPYGKEDDSERIYPAPRRWEIEATLSPSQYETFKENSAINITDPKEKIRGFAEIALRNGVK